jgi:hypothetical protein
MQIQSFRLHCQNVVAYDDDVHHVERETLQVIKQYGEWIAAAKIEASMKAALEEERLTWKWSPLFVAFRNMALPPAHQGPFQHTPEELQVLLEWAKTEILPTFEKNPIPPVVLAMKLMSC